MSINLEEDDGVQADEEMSDKESKNKHGMAGMADVINKILEKPTNKQDAILSKSKKSDKRKIEMKKIILEKKKRFEERVLTKEKGHIIPTKVNAQKEVLLKRIATKGVVKLFNAVSSHQKNMSERMKDANTESKKDKAATSQHLSKSTFMDLLTKKSQVSNNNDNKVVDSNPSKWDVLREDFMLGAAMKDWDKQDCKKASSESEEIDEDDSENDSENESA